MSNFLYNSLVFIGDKVQLNHVHEEEKYVAECICKLIKGKKKHFNIIEDLIELDLEQKLAVINCFDNRLFVISGLSGTGKTFVGASIYKIAVSFKMKCLVCAPTAKAAKRFSDFSKAECKTIHRMLGYAPNSEPMYRQNEDNKLICDMIIVDESSMVDLNILYHLFKALDFEKIRIVFVGDWKQLSPVRYGNPFKDMCLNFHVPKIQLTQIKRQQVGSEIIEQAHRIQQGKMIE